MSEAFRGGFACAFLFACIIFGGASAAGVLANASLQLLALLLILSVLWSKDQTPLKEGRWLALLGGLFVLVVILSLFPLSPSIWEELPGRESVKRGYELLGGGQPAISLSLAPERSIWSLASLLPPTAMFLVTLTLSSRWRRRLAWTLIAGAVLSIILSAFQLIGGSGSPLRFYQITNPTRAVGFFANANHLPTLILMAMPFLGVIAAKALGSRNSQKRSGTFTVTVSVALFFVVGVILSGSLSGYAMLPAVGLATYLLFRRGASGKLSPLWGGAIGVVTALVVAFAAWGPLNQDAFAGKFSSHSTSRATIWKNTAAAVRDYAPVGTGLGSFSAVYRTYDDPTRATREFVNHAHNDYLEFMLELGLAGALIILAFLAWLLQRSIYAWKEEFSGASFARMGSIIAGVALVHSGVDYPLRTAALACVFAMACGFLVPPAPKRRSESPDAPSSNLRHISVD